MRFVLDTNVLISAALLPASKPRKALDVAFRLGTVLVSGPTLTELFSVLERPVFRKYIDEADVLSFRAGIARQTELVEVNIQITACRDQRDDKFLELAVSGEAACIVSGDADLLALDPFRGIRILTVQAFLDLYLQQSGKSH